MADFNNQRIVNENLKDISVAERLNYERILCKYLTHWLLTFADIESGRETPLVRIHDMSLEDSFQDWLESHPLIGPNKSRRLARYFRQESFTTNLFSSNAEEQRMIRNKMYHQQSAVKNAVIIRLGITQFNIANLRIQLEKSQ